MALVRTGLCLLLAAVPLVGAAAPAPKPIPQADPVATVREAERQLRAAFKTNAGRSELERISGAAVDHEELARRSVGPRWAGFSPADRAAVTKGLRALVEETWLAGTFRPDPLFAFAITGSQVKGAEAEVRVVVQSGGRQGQAAFRLQKGKDRRFRIFDAAVNGVELLAGYREQFGQLLDAGGLPRLLESLEAQRKALVKMRSVDP